MKKEILRKLIHLSSLIYPILYLLFIEKREMLIMTGSISLVLILLEIAKKQSVFVLKLLNIVFKMVSREKEMEGEIFGSTYFMVAVFLVILLFERQIAIASMLVLVISDTAASLLGKGFGKKKLYKEKSLVGFLSFLSSAIIVSCFFNFIFIISATFAAFAELFAQKFKIDDNFLIPILYGAVSTLLIGTL